MPTGMLSSWRTSFFFNDCIRFMRLLNIFHLNQEKRKDLCKDLILNLETGLALSFRMFGSDEKDDERNKREKKDKKKAEPPKPVKPVALTRRMISSHRLDLLLFFLFFFLPDL